MATYVPPKRATAFRFSVSLFARAGGQIKTTPTLAAGDVKVSKDFGALANITTLPVETPAGSGILQVDLSATEMTADIAVVRFIDAAGAEWNDVAVNIQTAARQIDDLAFPATTGRSMVVDASGLVDANAVKVGPTGSGTAQTAADLAGATVQSAIADALLDRSNGVETGWTFRQAMRLITSVLTGKVSGAGTGTEVFRDLTDSKNRVSATVDSIGNRSAVTKDVS